MKLLRTALFVLYIFCRVAAQNAEAEACCLSQEGDNVIPRINAARANSHLDATYIIGEATRLLATYGAVVIEHLLPEEMMDQFVEDMEKDASGSFYGTKGSFAGHQTTRNAAKPLGQSKVCQEMAAHPVTVGVVKNMLEPYTKRVILGTNSNINVVGPQTADEPPAPSQVLHRDDTMWGGDWITNMACTNENLKTEADRFPNLSVSVMWAATDFTQDNGATQVSLFSHRQCPRTEKPSSDMKFIQATMPKGSVLLWAGGTFHGAKAPSPYDPDKTIDSVRRGNLFIYNLGMFRSEHNFHNAIPHDIIMSFDDELKDLLGYYGDNAAEHPWYIGPVYTQPYLGGPEGTTAGGDGSFFKGGTEPDSLFEAEAA